MRTTLLVLGAVAATALLAGALLGGHDTARADEAADAVYVSGDAHRLTFWRAGAEVQAVTYTIGYADPKVGTGPRGTAEETEEAGPPMLFKIGSQAGSGATPRAENLVTVGSVRWDEPRKVFVSTGPGDALTLWSLEDGEPVRARFLQYQVVPPFLDSVERERADGRTEEETRLSVPAKIVAGAVVFEQAPAGRILGPSPLR